MRPIAILLLSILASGAGFAAAAQYQYAGGTIYLNATEISGFGTNKIVLTEHAHMKIAARSGALFEADATNITIQLASAPQAGKTKPSGLDIKSADFTGPVKMNSCNPKVCIDGTGNKTTVMTRLDATADCARYDGVKQTAYLTGNVKMTQTDPTLYESPAIIEGQEVEINMKPNPNPDDLIFRIKTPGGVSRVEITPKAKEDSAN